MVQVTEIGAGITIVDFIIRVEEDGRIMVTGDVPWDEYTRVFPRVGCSVVCGVVCRVV